MSGKTKILVLHMKEVIYTGIFIFLGIVFIILLAVMFVPNKEASNTPSLPTESTQTAEPSVVTYSPGVYTATLEVSGNNIELQVIVEQNGITDVSFTHLDEAIETMYPLFNPVLDNIASQLRSGISLEDITYENSHKYTTLVLLDAISDVLEITQN